VKPGILNPHSRSLLRGSALVLLSLAAALLLSHFPNNHATSLLILPAIIAVIGAADTGRCMGPRWSLYHGGVLLLLYPYLLWIADSH
jgi:hypothetical protein